MVAIAEPILSQNTTVEQQIIAATDAIYMRFGEWSFAELEAGLQGIERQFAGVLEEADYLEVKRRVAEITLSAARDTEQPVHRCRELLERVEQLGWSTFYTKPSVLFPFVRYCLNHGCKDLGLHFLVPLIAELEQHYAHTGEEQCVFWLNHFRPLLAELQA